ncbi:DNA polymerase III subunit delta [Rhodococcus sp. HNM0569]|uniref:DNA polymerase III subunit delta n=1 Tax=Rhodococcus sp. HNM0569 TaxID=2716340 RepID=UPI00146EB438|nr:DNA polymerase III subunit delta [Rhodococcus sp. HNM0569]
MSTSEQLHLVLGDEELLIERAVARAVSGVGSGDVPVTRMRAGDAVPSEIAELLSPSLFAEDRVVVLEAAGEAGKDSVALVLDAAKSLPDGIVLVVVHSGGGRAKAMAGQLEKLGATVHRCAKLKTGEHATFVRREFAEQGVKVSGDVANTLVESVGTSLRELAAAVSQLVADTGGRVDATAVSRYYSGRAEVSGFDVADRAVAGDLVGAVEALRWATIRGVPHVLLADALADAVHSIARVAPAGRGDPFRLAPSLGMAPFKVKKAQAVTRHWTPASVGSALEIVATLNADVKGGAADPDFAVEHAVRAVAQLCGR